MTTPPRSSREAAEKLFFDCRGASLANALPIILEALQATRREALEEAAKVAESLRSHWSGMDFTDATEALKHSDEWIAKSIRALIKPAGCDHKEQKCMTCGVEFPVDKPTPEPDKCKHGCGDALYDLRCQIHSPKPPLPGEVEEKIKEIVHEFRWSGTPVSRKYDALRELCELMRK